MAKDEIVEAEEKPGADSFMTGMAIFTTVALLVAYFVIEYAWGHNYGAGFLAPK